MGTPSSVAALPPGAARTKNRKSQHFPGDPRFEITLSVTDEDVSHLREDMQLRTHLLDFLIQQAAPSAPPEGKTDQNGCTTYLAGLAVKHYIQESNKLLSDMKAHMRKIQRIRGSVCTIATNKRSVIIFPIIESHHFYILVVQIAPSSRSLYERVHCYDSLRHSERGRGQNKGPGTPEQQQFLEHLNTYVRNFIFHENEKLHRQPSSSTLSNKLEFRPCPGQANAVDCGLFSVGVVLHLLANVEIESNTFNQANVSHLRNLLGCFLHNRSKKVPSSLIRNCFPHLKGTSILHQVGIEEVDVTSPTTSTAATTSASAGGTASDEGSPAIPDLAMETLLRDSNQQVFACLDDVNPIVTTYEIQTGNRLRILRSERNKYRLYRCVAHVNCTYEVLFGRRRLDGNYILKRINNKHVGVHSAARARDGRRWKERRAGKLDKFVVQVLKTKKEPPIPADIVKTATSNGEVIPYYAAYRVLNDESKAASEERKLGFQLIIPYLDKFKEANSGSFVSYVRNDEDLTLKSLCVFPGFMNDSLKFVRPIISLDAAHLKSKYKGTLLVATVLSATNELYPLGFMITSGNEDLSSWTEMLTALKEACPRVATDTDDPGYYGEGVAPGLKFAFISDRDKGLKGAIQSVFPENLEINCAKHIEANVTQRRGFGQECARLVFPLARTFSTLHEAELLGKMRRIKPAAEQYVLGMTNGMWRGTSWMNESHPLPPRYGILTSNSSESVNSMLLDVRELGWLEAVNKILDIMSTKISQRREKHKERDGNEVVQRAAKVIRKSWDDGASMDVFNLEDGRNDYKVVDNSGVRPAATNDIRGAATLQSSHHSTHILRPGRRWCSCGMWQEYRYPCVHACAFFRKWVECDLQYVLQSEVDDCYTYSSVHGLFTRNIVPVVLDCLSYDGETKPPLALHKTAGRPKKKRMRNRSELLEESRVACSRCGERGHNRRTCTKEEGTLTAPA